MRAHHGLVALALLINQVVSSPQPIRPEKKACRSRQQQEKVFQAVPILPSAVAFSSISSTSQVDVDATTAAVTSASVSTAPDTLHSVASTITIIVPVTVYPEPPQSSTALLSSSTSVHLAPTSSVAKKPVSRTQPPRTTSVTLPALSTSIQQTKSGPPGETKPAAQTSAAAARIAPPTDAPKARDDKFVFAHFMMGIVATYTATAWEEDIKLAKSAGISGFALNTGADPHNAAQLDFVYAAADKIGDFQLFISVDFNIYRQGEYRKVADLILPYLGRKSQFRMDNRPFVSSFIGDGFEWDKVEAELKDKQRLYAVPFYEPKVDYAMRQDLSGLFSWSAWPGQVGLTPVKQNMTLERDNTYMSELGNANKIYMAPVSPWFFTHFPPEKYDKNWLFYSELLWYTRWEQMLSLGDRLNFIEIVSWNDYGESHHIGPYVPGRATDDGSSKWVEGLDHTAMLDMAIPYITAFRAGLKEPVITRDMVVYWYRPQLKDASCEKTDNCRTQPKGAEFVDDLVFVVVMSKNGGTLTVKSGTNPPVVHDVLPGSHPYSMPMGVGKQTFKFQAKGGEGREATDKVEISDQCRNGVYNFNFHSGSLKF